MKIQILKLNPPSKNLTKTKKPKSLWGKMMDLLARRDHSEKELIEKLKDHYPLEDIKKTIVEMKSRGWILAEKELSQKVCESLNRKNKSHLFIKQFLGKKGLPAPPMDQDLEEQKARRILHNHSSRERHKNKKALFLKNRGFDTETIMKILRD